MLKRTAARFRPAIGILIQANLAMFVVVITNGVSLFSLQPIIDQIFVASADPVTFVIPRVGWTIVESKHQMLLYLTAFFVVSRLLYCVSLYIQRYLMLAAGEIMVNGLRADLYDHLLSMHAAFFERRRTGEMVANLTSDLGLVQHVASTITGDLIRRPFETVFLVALLFWIDPGLATGSLLVAPFIALIVNILGKSVRRRSSSMQASMGDIAANLSEMIGGVRIVQAFAAEPAMSGRFRRLLKDYLHRARRAYLAVAASNPATELVTALAIAAIILYGGQQVIIGRLTPGQFFTFMAILMATYQPVKTLVNAISEAQRGGAALDRIYAILDEKPAIQSGEGQPAQFTRTLRFEDVTFAYTADAATSSKVEDTAKFATTKVATKVEAISHVNLEIHRGEIIAFVGPSGAGKTTLLSLIPRFHDPTSGAILLDDMDLRALETQSLRRLIGIVTQETFLFNDTLRENIRLGRPDATDDEVMTAAEAAQIADFIRGLPRGLDTIAGERGTRLSGGEKQRIAIARALLVDPPILILDEATSSLDSESERAVQAAVEQLVRGRTVLVIAHRLSTVQNASRIVVLDHGKMVESGTHADLLATGGLYASLHAIQFKT